MPEHYWDMVDWSDIENLSEPPATKNISNDDLLAIGSGEKVLMDFIPKVFSHSIANERAVQATSKKVAVKNGHKKVKISLLLTGKSIKKVPYKFRKAHFSSLEKSQKITSK